MPRVILEEQLKPISLERYSINFANIALCPDNHEQSISRLRRGHGKSIVYHLIGHVNTAQTTGVEQNE
jgi:hypothetical protein